MSRGLPWRALLLSAIFAHGAAGAAVELARGGQSDFHLSLPVAAPQELDSTAARLRDGLGRVTGAWLPIRREAAPAAHALRLELVDDSSSSGWGREGFRLRVGDDAVELAARTPLGLHHAVATFLEEQVGVRVFSPWESEFPRRPDLLLDPLEKVSVPAFPGRLQDFKERGYNAFHKLGSLDGRGSFVHTFHDLIPPERWFAVHPEWFSENRGLRVPDGQLCLTDSLLLEELVAELGRRMAADPAARIWSVSQNDTYLPCGCARCAALDSLEGSPSGTLLRFVNQVAARFPDKTLSTLAYQYSRRPPRLTRPAPNVEIMLCSIESGRQRPLEESDPDFVRDLEGWSRLTGNLFVWDYVIQFPHLGAPFPNLHVLAPNLRLFARQGAQTVFEQGLAQMRGESAELRAWLLAKLLWDPWADPDSLTNRFLQDYHGPAAPFIAAYHAGLEEALAASGEGLSCFGHPLPSERGPLSAARLERSEAFFGQALAAVAGDPVLERRVRTARLPVLYTRLEQARRLADAPGGCFVRDGQGRRSVAPRLAGWLEAFAHDVEEAGWTRLHEHGRPPAGYLEEYQRFLAEGCRPHLALGRPVELEHPAGPGYVGGNPSALVDGLSGPDDFRVHWLGVEGADLVATVWLDGPTPVHTIQTCFLQEIGSWIFLPLDVELEVLEEGGGWRSLGRFSPKIDPHAEGTLRWPVSWQADGAPLAALRLRARGWNTCPPWHKGAGGKAWVFCDELRVD